MNNIPYGNATIGTIDGNGNYIAPNNIARPGTVTITATSVVDTTNPAAPTVRSKSGSHPYGDHSRHLASALFRSRLWHGIRQHVHRDFRRPAAAGDLCFYHEMITAIGTATAAQAGQVTVIVTILRPAAAPPTACCHCDDIGYAGVTPTAAVRFLEQVSSARIWRTVNQVQETGFDQYLQNQFASAVTPYPTPRPNDSINNVQQTYFLNAIAGGDQLRGRVALALNELWVVGADKISDPLGYTNYLSTLDKDALGNYLT